MKFEGTVEEFLSMARIFSSGDSPVEGCESHNARFTDNDDGTITDSKTGLMRLKEASFVGEMNWKDAIDTCKGLATAGHADWRLPDRAELLSLVDISTHDPAIPNGHPFVNVQSYGYWSSSTYATFASSAWLVDMCDGSVDHDDKSIYYYVWPVRSDN